MIATKWAQARMHFVWLFCNIRKIMDNPCDIILHHNFDDQFLPLVYFQTVTFPIQFTMDQMLKLN